MGKHHQDKYLLYRHMPMDDMLVKRSKVTLCMY